jgi:hypothetical protein
MTVHPTPTGQQITVPSNDSGIITGGENSPTGVVDLCYFPSWLDSKDPPSWYAKGDDVDALLDVADTLDWLADSGDLNEQYLPPFDEVDLEPNESVAHVRCEIPTASSVTTLPHVDSNTDSMVPSLPDLFDNTHESSGSFQQLSKGVLTTSHLLLPTPSTASLGDHLHVFDNPMEEHDFVSTILESSDRSRQVFPSFS